MKIYGEPSSQGDDLLDAGVVREVLGIEWRGLPVDEKARFLLGELMDAAGEYGGARFSSDLKQFARQCAEHPDIAARLLVEFADRAAMNAAHWRRESEASREGLAERLKGIGTLYDPEDDLIRRRTA